MSFKQWYENNHGYDVFNNKTYQDWYYNTFLEKTNKDKFNDFVTLTRKNVDALKSIFGRQTSIYMGEFRSYVWKREFKGKIFLIFSSNKGTSIEIITDNNNPWDRKNKGVIEDGKVTIDFVKDLLQNLKEYYSKEGEIK